MRVQAGGDAERAPTEKSVSTLDLVRNPTRRNLGELSFRLGIPLGALILALLAIPLSFVNPRAGRSMNLLLALLIYMCYANMMSIAQASIAQSRITFVVGTLGVHTLDGQWDFSLWGNNLTDEYYWLSVTQNANTIIRFPGKSATWGASLTYRF